MHRNAEASSKAPRSPAKQWLRGTARSAYYLIRGGGKPELDHKRVYHKLRADCEQKFVAEARENPLLLKPNYCPACGSQAKREEFTNPVGFHFGVCADCGTVYMDPVPTDDSLGRLYNDASYAFHWTDALGGQGGDQFDYEKLILLAAGDGSEKKRLLDVGCASGGFLETCRNEFQGDGVELNSETAEIARRRGFDVVTGRLEDVDRPGYYDVISMRQLIEHITEPVELLRQARRLLRPGGIVYLNTPNPDSASFKLLKAAHTHVSSFGHVSLLTREGLARVAARAGLELSAHGYRGGADYALHDALTRPFPSFRHRMARYSPRTFHFCALIDSLSFGLASYLVRPAGHESYHWAALRAPSES